MVKRAAATTFTSFLPQKVRRRGKKQEAEDDQTLGKGGNTGTQHPETGPAEYCPLANVCKIRENKNSKNPCNY
ncbi:hypothetical protein [Phocaeicola dorei]|uniref:hypothetical protein n=1 Tax=Phocaeicola dorei TaxID=357276 RepID=UPI00319EA0A1